MYNNPESVKALEKFFFQKCSVFGVYGIKPDFMLNKTETEFSNIHQAYSIFKYSSFSSNLC